MQVGEKSKWQLKREASYRALVDSAGRRFHDDGYAATRVEDIVAGTGYTSGAFYFHFANKTDCFWHVIADRQRRRGNWSTLVDDFDPATHSLTDVFAAVFAHFDATLDGLEDWVLAMVDFHQQHRGDREQAAKLAEIYEQWLNELRAFISRLQAGGWLASREDPDLLATQVFAFGEGLRAHARMYDIDRATFATAMRDGLTKLLGA